MTTTVIRPGVVKVEPDQLDENDVMEFAEALIEEHGHVKNTGGDAGTGWSIHGAIGEAARRATGEGGKDGSRSRVLRDAAATKIADLGRGTEITINDASDQAGAIAALREARGAV